MRFKAELPRESHSIFYGVVQRLEKMESAGVPRSKRRAVLMLSPQGVNMALVATTDDVLAFAELSPDIFRDFRVQSAAEDCILVSLALAHLSRALASGRDAPSTLLKLAKRDGAPCVVVTVEKLDLTLRSDIPVRLMRAGDLKHYAPPTFPPPRAALELPAAPTLRRVVERLKAVGERLKGESRIVAVRVEAHGTLALRCLTPSATIKTFFPNLSAPGGGVVDGDPDAVVCVRVDSRKLHLGLSGYGLDAESIACYPHERRSLLFHVVLANGRGSLSFYCPVVDDDDVEEDDANGGAGRTDEPPY